MEEQQFNKLIDHLVSLSNHLQLVVLELKSLNERMVKKARAPRKEVVQAGGLPEIAMLWNKYADMRLPRVLEMDRASGRYKACKARWDAKPDPDYWLTVINRMNRSSWCLGTHPDCRPGWKANIEFLTQADRAAKILEGQHDDKKTLGAKYRDTGVACVKSQAEGICAVHKSDQVCEIEGRR